MPLNLIPSKNIIIVTAHGLHPTPLWPVNGANFQFITLRQFPLAVDDYLIFKSPFTRYNDGDYYPDGMPRQQLQQQMNGPGSPRYSSGHGGLGRDRFRDRVTIDRERGGGGPPGAGGYQDQGGDRYGDDEYISTPQQMKRQMRGESMGRELAGQMGPPPRGSQNSRNSDGNYPPVAYRNNMQKSPGKKKE